MHSTTRLHLCLLATLPSAHGATVILGDQSGDPRGVDSLDVQSFRVSGEYVAHGEQSVAVGVSNESFGDFSISVGINNRALSSETIALGRDNYTTGLLSSAVGQDNFVWADDYYEGSAAFGYGNEIGWFSPYMTSPSFTHASSAFGILNFVRAHHSSAHGRNNIIGADSSFAAGLGNTLDATGSSAFGSNIINSVSNSTMIGPSDAAKVTILSSGNVGIGTPAPAEKLEVAGNAKITGTLTVGGSSVLTTAGGSGANLTGLNASNISSGNLLAARLPVEAVQLASTQTLTNKTLSAAKLTGATTLGGSTAAQQVLINATGNIGIGTTNLSPSTKLEVAGNAKISGALSAGSAAISSELTVGGLPVLTSAAFSNTPYFPQGFHADFGSGAWFGQSGSPQGITLSGGPYLNLAADYVVLGSASVGLGVSGLAEIAVESDDVDYYNPGKVTLRPPPGHWSNPEPGTIVADGNTELLGKVKTTGDITVKNRAVVRVSPAGDIGMGSFTSGSNPEL